MINQYNLSQISKFKYRTDRSIIVGFSGGMDSCLNAWVLKLAGYSNVKLLFADTNSEDSDTYRFLHEAVDFLEYELITLDNAGKTIWDVFVEQKYLGNSRVDPCSHHLKRKTAMNYYKNIGVDYTNTILCFGIDLFEKERLDRLRSRYDNVAVISPLADYYLDSENLKEAFYVESGIEEQYLYKIGMNHANCGGFCVKAGLAHYRNLYEKDRDRYLYFEMKEQEMYDKIPKAVPFLKKQVNGVRKGISLRDYRITYLESGETSTDEDLLPSCITCMSM